MKRRKPKTIPVAKPTTLSEYLATYDSPAVRAALQSMEGSLAWDIFRAYLKVRQREFEVAALDLLCHTGMHQEAAKASGYAQGMEEVATTLMDEFRKLLNGDSGVVEDPMPSE